MSFDYKKFCENLSKLRKEKGYSKYEISIQADIPYTYYLAIENGQQLPNFKRVISIANALNTDIAHLIGEKQYSKLDKIKKDILSELIKIENDKLLYNLFNILVYIRVWSDVNQ